MYIKVAKLFPSSILPTVKNFGDAGMDFYSLENYIIPAYSFQICRTGITIEVPKGYVAQVWPKSKSNWLVGAGIIDYGYQGEVLIKITNITKDILTIREGDALAQIVFVSNVNPEVLEVDIEDIHAEKTARGSTGGIVTQVVTMEVPHAVTSSWIDDDINYIDKRIDDIIDDDYFPDFDRLS